MGRPKKAPTAIFGVRMCVDLVAYIDALIAWKPEEVGRSRAEVIHRCFYELRKEYGELPELANPPHVRLARRRTKKWAGQPLDVIKSILQMQSGRCAYCPRAIKIETGQFHVDHIIPVAKGGIDQRRNLQITCIPCNSRKKDKDPIRFAQENGKLL